MRLSREPVTVILPVRNRADVILRSVSSVLSQSHPIERLIVIDDGSTDDTFALVQGLRNPRIDVQKLPENCGVAEARNLGLDIASTRLVAFQDSDDIWHPRKLELQIDAMQLLLRQGLAPAAMGCGHSNFFTSPPSIPVLPSQVEVRIFSKDEVVLGCSVGAGTPKLLIDRDHCEAECRFDPMMPAMEDRDFVARLLTGDVVFASVEAPLVLVQRSRTDHQANDRNFAVAHERYQQVHAAELESNTEAMQWHVYQRVLRNLIHERNMELSQLRLQARGLRPYQQLHLLLAKATGRNGIRLMSKLRLQPSTRTYCQRVFGDKVRGESIWMAVH